MKFSRAHHVIADTFQKPFLAVVEGLYEDEMSTYEISEYVLKKTGIYLSPRAYQRWLHRINKPLRSKKESLWIARKKNRWQKKR